MRTRGLIVSAAFLGALLGAAISTTVEMSAERSFAVRIVESKLGTLAVRTTPGASCQAFVALPAGGTRPHKIGDALIAGPDGSVRWSYLISVPGARGVISYTVTCSYSGLSAISRAEFDLAGAQD